MVSMVPGGNSHLAPTRRQGNVMTVEVEGVPHHYAVLNINEFTSTRKRMSCVVQEPSGRLLLLCKVGVDVALGQGIPLVAKKKSCSICESHGNR